MEHHQQIHLGDSDQQEEVKKGENDAPLPVQHEEKKEKTQVQQINSKQNRK
jgi:hypothetical protein